jgi:hypothetical protein
MGKYGAATCARVCVHARVRVANAVPKTETLSGVSGYMPNLLRYLHRKPTPKTRSPSVVAHLTDGLTQSHSSLKVEWVIYDSKEGCVYFRRKMSWVDATSELRALLEPYEVDHEWSSRLSVKYWGPDRFPKGMLVGAERTS